MVQHVKRRPAEILKLLREPEKTVRREEDGMFFKNKILMEIGRLQELVERIAEESAPEKLQVLEKENAAMLQSLEKENADMLQALEKENAVMRQALESLGQKMDSLTEKAERHDFAIEEMLEEWEDLRKDTEDSRECREAEKNLALLSWENYEQLRILGNAAKGNEAWERQLALALRKSLEEMAKLNIAVIAAWQEPVNYELHEVIVTAETQEESRHGTVKETFESGLIYKGEVLKKAKVCAWAYRSAN